MPSTNPSKEKKSLTVKELWAQAWSEHGIGKIPAKEHRFHPIRKFRFDFAWPALKVAVETDGYGGGHQTNAKLAKDNEKCNLAIECGWLVLRFTNKQLGSKQKRKDAAKLVLKILKERRLCTTICTSGPIANAANCTKDGST